MRLRGRGWKPRTRKPFGRSHLRSGGSAQADGGLSGQVCPSEHPPNGGKQGGWSADSVLSLLPRNVFGGTNGRDHKSQGARKIGSARTDRDEMNQASNPARNLAADRPDTVGRLTKNLRTWRSGIKSQIIPDDHPLQPLREHETGTARFRDFEITHWCNLWLGSGSSAC